MLEDVLSPQSIFDYDVRVNQYTYDLEKYFPPKTIQGKTYEFTQNESTQVMASRYTVHNAPTDLISRENYKVSRAGLAYTKIGISLDEDDMMALATPQSDIAYRQALTNIYDDSSRVISAIREKREIQRAQVLFTGKLKIEENGVIDEFDFGIPDSNRKDLKWLENPTRDIYGDIMEIVDLLSNNGQNVPPAYILARPKVITDILMDEKIRAMMSTYNALAVPTRQNLNDWMRLHDLPIFVPYNRVATFPDETLSKGTQKALLDENTVVFIPEGALGETINGTTPEEAHATLRGLPTGAQMSRQDDIVLQTFGKPDPENEMIKASARFFTTLKVPKQIVIGTLKNNG